jgi:nicotinate dehydrogenase subunit B
MRLAFNDDGSVQVRTGKVELGQGILTALAQIAADELGVAAEQVQVLAA